ncbi:cytochrome c oxidase subunit 4 [Thermasporomyces composti]|uniref:Cytochrome c oxidase polypeptide 4 n=1 Tax=Thermasporomyces composti TaxID=696763 RepID=A0A3D9UZE0_THECX|nr:cytochrome c oxidase subunit 4 [Thermasporomyces composti]REF34902.1 cytochrome c oxidase subunit IV [Thermasporomyces composti]
MKIEGFIFLCLTAFFAMVTPVYWFLSHDPTGTAALLMSTLLAGLIGFYTLITARRVGPRPEDRKDADIEEGAGELGFFSPHSWWPLYCGLSLALAVLGVVFGWWLFLIAVGVGTVSVLGLVFEYYRGVHAH